MELMWSAKEWCIINGWAGAIEIDWDLRHDLMAWCSLNIAEGNYVYDGFILKVRKPKDLVFASLRWS